ncbi:hypothetical protein K432DRAFT_3171 [Lepidopterella palustris CBS 459.81]|uniref:Uncharacterized protein n=1 Tax=Lepidopterella palustris CBS 459.81 TaxID=1314670 RepID=A0A8E2EKQ5_9PEZI|nr:hypothetical protein K432DRAFT_3171 [Lepidopterella palustris CBS 459.81]
MPMYQPEAKTTLNDLPEEMILGIPSLFPPHQPHLYLGMSSAIRRLHRLTSSFLYDTPLLHRNRMAKYFLRIIVQQPELACQVKEIRRLYLYRKRNRQPRLPASEHEEVVVAQLKRLRTPNEDKWLERLMTNGGIADLALVLCLTLKVEHLNLVNIFNKDQWLHGLSMWMWPIIFAALESPFGLVHSFAYLQ